MLINVINININIKSDRQSFGERKGSRPMMRVLFVAVLEYSYTDSVLKKERKRNAKMSNVQSE